MIKLIKRLGLYILDKINKDSRKYFIGVIDNYFVKFLKKHKFTDTEIDEIKSMIMERFLGK